MSTKCLPGNHGGRRGAEMEWDDDQVSRFLVFSHRIDKKAVTAAVKAGEEVPGAHMVERNNIQIEGAK